MKHKKGILSLSPILSSVFVASAALAVGQGTYRGKTVADCKTISNTEMRLDVYEVFSYLGDVVMGPDLRGDVYINGLVVKTFNMVAYFDRPATYISYGLEINQDPQVHLGLLALKLEKNSLLYRDALGEHEVLVECQAL